jgi:hypothetical protein
MIGWRQHLSPDVCTGNLVSAIVDDASRTYAYSERRAWPSPDLSPPRLAREDALSVAGRAAIRQSGAPEPLELHHALLVLTSVLSPTGGPVWQGDYLQKADGEYQRPGIAIAVDAVTGVPLGQ